MISERRLTVDQWNTRTVSAPFTDTLKVALQKVRTANLKTLFDDLRCELVHTILGGITKNMVDGAATIGRSTMLANMLDAPIAELPVGHDVDAIENFGNARTLHQCFG